MNHWGLTCQSRRHRAESLDPAQDLAPILVRPRVLRGVDEVNAATPLATGVDDLLHGAGLRATGTTVTEAGELAVIEATTYEEIFATVATTEGPARAEAYTDAYFASLREGLDNPADYDDLLLTLKSDPAAPYAYARAGDAALNNAGGLADDVVDSFRGCANRSLVDNSFGAGTLVLTAGGTLQPIETIAVGDQVIVFDEHTQTRTVSTVTATSPHQDWLVTATLEDGSTISVTDDHRFYNATSQTWVEIGDFAQHDQLLTATGTSIGLVELDEAHPTYAQAFDLTVADNHNYFVAGDDDAAAVLVHNQRPCPDFVLDPEFLDLYEVLGEADYDSFVSAGNAIVRSHEARGLDAAQANLRVNELALFAAIDTADYRALGVTEEWLVAASTADAGFLNVIETAATNAGFARIDAEVLEAVAVRSDFDDFIANADVLGAEHLEAAFVNGLLKANSDRPVAVLRDMTEGRQPVTSVRADGRHHVRTLDGISRIVQRPADTAVSVTPIADGTLYRVRTRAGDEFDQVHSVQDFLVGGHPRGLVVAGPGRPIVLADINIGQAQLFTGQDFRQANLALFEAIDRGEIDDIVDDVHGSLKEWARRGENEPPLDFGLTWHHHEDVGRMQLMDSPYHVASSHTGGSTIWGDRMVERLRTRSS